MYKNKKVLVTGGTGLIGRSLTELLLQEGAEVKVVSLDDWRRCQKDAVFVKGDLTYYDVCKEVVQGMDYVFHLAGIKGSPAMVAQRPADFFTPMILFNTNMMRASFREGVERYLYTSSCCVYSPREVFYEDDTWSGFPSKNDWFAGWAKRMGELQAEAYKIQYGWDKVAIVRPSNVYGSYDNFDPDNAQVIPSLIKRAMDGENPLVVWGDGSAMRDFIYSNDMARGMMLALEYGVGQAMNIGSGVGSTIKEIVEIIVSNMEVKPGIVWDTSKPSGDAKRLPDITRVKSIGFKPTISLEQGIKETMDWYSQNKDKPSGRYNIFTERKIR